MLVGAPGFEPETFRSQSERATKLRYTPLVVSGCPPWIRTGNLPVQSRAQLPIVLVGNGVRWCSGEVLNLRPGPYQDPALTPELPELVCGCGGVRRT